MQVFNTLAPVFLIIFLGIILEKTGFLSEKLTQETNRLVYWLALPCLLFYESAKSHFMGGAVVRVGLVMLSGTAVCIILGYLVSRWLNLPGSSEGAFVQASFRGNLAYIGLPVVSYALSNPSLTAAMTGFNPEQLQSIAVLSFAPIIPVYNVAAVIALVAGSGRVSQSSWTALIRPVLTNPLLLSCMLGLSFSLMGFTLPSWLGNTCRTIGQMALPLALLGIGTSLATTKVKGQVTPSVLASLLKVAAAPLVGWLVADWLGLSVFERAIALLYLACPTAAASYVMASQLGGDLTLTSSAIVVSTVLSGVALAVILAFSF